MKNINKLIMEAYYGTLHEGIAENVYRRIKNDVKDQDIDLEEYKLSLDIIQRLLQSKKDKIGQDTLKSWNKQSTDITEVLKSISELYGSEDSTKIRQKSNRNSGLKDLYTRALKAEKDDVIEIVNKKDIMAGKHNLIMIKPLTKEASIDFGCDNWCTSNSRDNAQGFVQYVSHGSHNMLYIHLDPKQSKEMNLPKIKYTWAIRFNREGSIKEIQDMSNDGKSSVDELNKILKSFGVTKGIESYLNYTEVKSPLDQAFKLLGQDKDLPHELIDEIGKSSQMSFELANRLLSKSDQLPNEILNGIIKSPGAVAMIYIKALWRVNKKTMGILHDALLKSEDINDLHTVITKYFSIYDEEDTIHRLINEIIYAMGNFENSPMYYYDLYTDFKIQNYKISDELENKLIDGIIKDSEALKYTIEELKNAGIKVPEKIKRLLKIGGYDSIKTTEGGKVTYGVFNTNLKEENSNDISSIEDKWREKGLSVYVYDRGDYWYLAELIVPKGEQKQGLGSLFMNDLIELADTKGKRITLTPAMKDKKHGTTSRSRLQKFYKKFGFVTNTGRNKDFTVNADQMYRDPKSINEVTISKPKIYNSRGFKYIKAYEGGENIGELIFTLDFPKEGYANIEWIEVDKKYQRSGVASDMINALKDLIPEYEMTARSTSDKSYAMLKKHDIIDRSDELEESKYGASNPNNYYHGTPKQFDKFTNEYLGTGIDANGIGFYFTSSRDEALGYAGDDGYVLTVRLDVNNPIIVDSDTNLWKKLKLSYEQNLQMIKKAPNIMDSEESPLGDFFDTYWEGGPEEWMLEELASKFTGHPLDHLYNDLYDDENAILFLDNLNGVIEYDGVVAKYNNGIHHVIAFSLDQINIVNNEKV